MSASDLGAQISAWAHQEPSVRALVQIGSRVRAIGHPAAADSQSDWDFQIITSRPEKMANPDWLIEAGISQPLAYVFRQGRLGSATKVTALFSTTELDLVVIPSARLGSARLLVKLGMGRRLASLRKGLGDLAVVIADGYRIIKGEKEWGAFYHQVATRFTPPPLGDSEVCVLADGFVCDYVSTCRKIERGELLAAQRWIHHQLAETNFRLLHELRRRRGEVTFPDARRLERFAPADLERVTVEALPKPASLAAAADKAAASCRALMRDLVGARWQWPDLSPLRLRAE